MLKRLYSTDLSDAAWKLIARLLPAARIGGRPRTTDLRAVINAIFYLLRAGCQWRLLPRGIPSMGHGLSLLPGMEECGRVGPFAAHHLQALAQRGRSVKTTERGCRVVRKQWIRASWSKVTALK